MEAFMKQHLGWWLPDEETHLQRMLDLGRGTYQATQRTMSLQGLPKGGIAIDVGSNVGLWLRDLCTEFDYVYAIEPIEDFRQCIERNCTQTQKYLLVDAVLQDRQGWVDMVRVQGNAGHTHVGEGSGSYWATTLDQLLAELHPPDRIAYIKIDCEGRELEVVQGAKQTILRDRPRICVEQKPHLGPERQYLARDLLISWGYRTRPHHGDDLVLAHPDQEGDLNNGKK
jgi:FkbM family methyltransferase